MSGYTVYELIDCLDGVPHYVGMAQDADKRYKAHLFDDKTNPGKSKWVKKLKAEGRVPAMRIIEIVEDEGQARERERFWIAQYFLRGYPLFNIFTLPSGASTVPLQAIRENIGATREVVMRRARSIGIGTVRNAEKGRRVTYASAQEILAAINALLQEAGREPVTLDDLGLKLY